MVGELPDPAPVAGSAFAELSRRGRRDRPASAPSPPPSPARSWRSCAASSRSGCRAPTIDAVAAACAVVRDAVRAGRLASAHDVSDGGLACALAESAIAGGVGCRVDLQPLRERGCSPEEALFGEGAGGFLVSGERAALEAIGADPDRRGRRRRRSRSPPATAASPSASRTPRAPGARCRVCLERLLTNTLRERSMPEAEERCLKRAGVAVACRRRHLRRPSGLRRRPKSAAAVLRPSAIGNYTMVQLSQAGGAPLAAPAAGVVTKWKVNSALAFPPGFTVAERLRIFRCHRRPQRIPDDRGLLPGRGPERGEHVRNPDSGPGGR